MRKLTFLLFVSAPALAADPAVSAPPVIPPAVWMGPVAASSASGASLIARRFEDAARREVRKLKTARLAGPKERVRRIKAGDPDPRVQRAENHRTTGQALYDAGKLDAARLDLEAALELYEHAIASVQRIGAVARTAGYLGAVFWKVGRKKTARDWFWRAAILATDDEVEALPEAVRAEVQTLRKKAARNAKGRIHVKSVPRGAEVRVDGEPRGTAPLWVKGLAPGTHYVQIRHEAGWAGAVVTLKGRRPKHKVTLVAEPELGPRDAQPVPGDTIKALLDGFENKKPETHSKRARRRKLAARAKTLKRALQKTRALSHADYAVLSIVDSDGRGGFVARTWVHELAHDRRLELEPLRLGADVANVFVPALAYAKAVGAAVEKLRTTPPEHGKKKPRRKRKRKR